MGILWDGTGINCYGMGMGQINMYRVQPCLYNKAVYALVAFFEGLTH